MSTLTKIVVNTLFTLNKRYSDFQNEIVPGKEFAKVCLTTFLKGCIYDVDTLFEAHSDRS